jgi:hypothetical protein
MVPGFGSNWTQLWRSQNLFLPLIFNDFDVRLARPLGRLGASRPPAAGEGTLAEANPWANLRNSSLRCQESPARRARPRGRRRGSQGALLLSTLTH